LRLLSISFASWLGSMVTFLLQRGSQPSKGSTMPLKGFTSSVKIAQEPE
jgi:hypothetical protein